MNRTQLTSLLLTAFYMTGSARALAQPAPAPTQSATTGASSANVESDHDPDAARRSASLHLGSTLSGATGLLRVSEAGASAPGTFRLWLDTSYFSGSGELCSAASPCPAFNGEAPTSSDQLTRTELHLGATAALLPFLEAYASLHNSTTRDSRSRPPLAQVLGDGTLGVKGFTPKSPDRLLSVGGAAELLLLHGSGGVGLSGASTSFALRALGTLDLDDRSDAAARVPLRFHLNAGYKFDNSAQAVKAAEHTPPPDGRGETITRVERFSLGLNRVDFVEFGAGAEFVHEYVRPFVEWTLDIPANRQHYVCNTGVARAHGEGCLAANQGFATSPSRLTLGARAFPWPEHDLSLRVALDIGTGATSKFVEEIAPELPWDLWLGLAYAFDTVPPKPIIQRIAAPAPPPPPPAPPPSEYVIDGVVVDKSANTPIAKASIKFDGRDLTGMISRDDGSFQSAPLDPGTYTLDVSASGYHDGQCSATVGPNTPAVSPAPASPSPASPAAPTPPAAPPVSAAANNASSPAGIARTTAQVRCELEALPKVGSVMGSLLDADNNAPVANAQIKVSDNLKRELTLSANADGAFRFENVPPGALKVTVEAPGYFTNVSEVTVLPHEEITARILLNKRPAQPNVVVAGHEIKLKKQVHFQTDSADILPDSQAILEEFADVMRTHAEIQQVEVQGHTDNTGNEAYNLRLSQERAQAVVDAIAKLGVDPSRMTPKGYGQSKPLLPNSSEANRARNRRVQVLIIAQAK